MLKCKGQEVVVTAADVTAGTIAINFSNSTSGAGALVQVRTTAGVTVAWDGAVSVANSGVITVDNTGAVDWADTDVITAIAF